MSMISEQVKQLKEEAKYLVKDQEKRLASILYQAANTIESLSAKLQAANMERSAEDCEKSVLEIQTPKVCIDCPCHFAGESGMVMCGVEKRELLTDDIETYKPFWCPMKRWTVDCGGGWIPCSERLPEENKEVICCFKSGIVEALVLFNCKFHGKVYAYEKSDIIAWQPLPEPYHEP